MSEPDFKGEGRARRCGALGAAQVRRPICIRSGVHRKISEPRRSSVPFVLIWGRNDP